MTDIWYYYEMSLNQAITMNQIERLWFMKKAIVLMIKSARRQFNQVVVHT